MTRDNRPSLTMRRIFDAPRGLVWLAWSHPEMRLSWYGPVEWPAVSSEQDFRTGGKWRTCLKSATDDRVLWQGGVFHEIVEPTRLVFTFQWEGNDHEDGPPVETLVTVVLSELPDGRTEMHFTQQGLKSEQSLSGHKYGWTSTFERLDAWLVTQRPS